MPSIIYDFYNKKNKIKWRRVRGQKSPVVQRSYQLTNALRKKHRGGRRAGVAAQHTEWRVAEGWSAVWHSGAAAAVHGTEHGRKFPSVLASAVSFSVLSCIC